jgi:ABC-type spermidine/putrescine transport system permease subunit II
VVGPPSRHGLGAVGVIRSPRALGRWVLTAAAGGTLAFILLPLVFVIWLAFFEQAIPSFPPRGYSLKWFVSIADNPRFVDGFWLSLRVAIAAMCIGLALGVPGALCLARYRFPGREPLGNLLLLPLVVPGIVLGTSLYVFHVEATMATGLPRRRRAELDGCAGKARSVQTEECQERDQDVQHRRFAVLLAAHL